MKQIEVLMADEHAVIRDALRNITSDTDDMVVAGEVSSGNEVPDLVRATDWGPVRAKLL